MPIAFPDHSMLVKVDKQALGLVQYGHVVAEIEAFAVKDGVVLLQKVQTVELDDEAPVAPNRGSS